MQAEHPVGVYLTAAVVPIAAFLTWGTFEAVPTFDSPMAESMMREAGFDAPVMTFTITGWNGYMNLGPLNLPNWLVVISSLGVALLAWLRASGASAPPKPVRVALAAYGVVHVGLLIGILGVVGEASPGAGALAALAACISLLVMAIRDSDELEMATRYEVVGARRGGQGSYDRTPSVGAFPHGAPSRPGVDAAPPPPEWIGGSVDRDRSIPPPPEWIGGSVDRDRSMRPPERTSP